MDSNAFDRLTKLVGQGASRRSILKGLLGLGGATVAGGTAVDSADARTARTRPTIPPPPPPGCQLPNQLCGGVCCAPGDCHDGVCIDCESPGVVCGVTCCETGVCTNSGTCCDAGEKACGTECCEETESCARNGNTDYCCTAASCGLDCCEDPLQCCDEECCGEEDVCLARVYTSSEDGFEETCCPAGLTCDGGCCDGGCFVREGRPIIFNGFPLLLALVDRECCPAGNSVCQGWLNAECCDDATEQCCVDASGVAVCAPIDNGCCEDIGCLPLPPDSDACTDAICGPDHLCTYPSCSEGLECCVNAPDPVCLDLSVVGVCCTTSQCENGCQVCEATQCVAVCEGDDCCMPPTDPTTWTCRPEGGCCSDEECTGEGELCCNGACTVAVCCTDDDCEAPETCCIIGDFSICLDRTVDDSCCTAGDCPPPSGECLVATCIDFQCGEAGDPTCCNPQCGIGQQCCPGGYCIDSDDTCCNALTELEDCGEGFACCGGRCEPGECCTGIADDNRCDPRICCRDANGTFCVDGPTCPATTTTAPATTPPPVTTTTDPGATTTSPPGATTTPPATTTTAPGCTTDSECGTGMFCNDGTCAIDRCAGPSECDPCFPCNRLTGDCTALCPDPCQFCDEETFPRVCRTRSGCCTNGCFPLPGQNCGCQPSTGDCLCTPVPPTTPPPATTTPAPTCDPTTCAAQNRCDGNAWLTHQCVGNVCQQTSTVCTDNDICTENFCTEGIGCQSRLRTDTCNPASGVVCCPRGWDCLVATSQCNCSSGNVCSDGSCGNLCCTAADCQSQEMGVIPCVECVDNACVAVNNGQECQGTGVCNNRVCTF